jgi:hypothetical protein
MDRVARPLEASQRMELSAGEVHILWAHSLIKTVQQPQDAILQATIDSTRPALAP